MTTKKFTALLRTKGLQAGVTYSFASRRDANESARIVRDETMWRVLWVGPQQFEVE